MDKKEKICIITIKRNLGGFGRINKVVIKENCNNKQISAIFKKRNININDINLVKKD